VVVEPHYEVREGKEPERPPADDPLGNRRAPSGEIL